MICIITLLICLMFLYYVLCNDRNLLTEIVCQLCKTSKRTESNMINLYLKVYEQRFDMVADRIHNMMCLRWVMFATLTNLLRNTKNNWRLRLGNKIKTSEGLFHSLYHGGVGVWDPMKTDSKTIVYVLIENSLPANLIFQKLYINE